jgi:hypothetical protein
MGKYDKKNLRGNWQEEDLQNAMRVVRTSHPSTNAAEIHYKVPRRTLRAFLAENKQSKCKMGRKTTFTTARERVIQENY